MAISYSVRTKSIHVSVALPYLPEITYYITYYNFTLIHYAVAIVVFLVYSTL